MEMGATFEDALQFVNLLSKTTGEYYVLHACRTNMLCFSENIRELTDLFSSQDTRCSLEQWLSIVDASDLPRINRVLSDLLSGKQTAYDINYRIRCKDGSTIWINCRGSIFRGKEENTRYILGQITSQPRADRNSSSELRATLKKELQEIHKQGRDGYLLMVGVDNLSKINLKYGREYGDTLLYNLAENMISYDARVDWVSRINGDCFCAILLDHSEKNVKTYFSNLQKRMKEQCTISGGCVSLRAYQVPDGATLIQYAESSLQTAKASGKNRLSFFAPSDYERRLTAISLQEELEYGIKQDFAGFSLDYQAQVRSETLALYGAEALLRFCSPRRGQVSPAEFIPILEEAELIYPVGLWVLREALAQCRKCRAVFPDFHVSVNMSFAQLSREGILSDVLQLVRQSGVPGSALTIEVTESMQLRDYPQLNRIFSKWKAEGIEISVDDFGTGYSSLSWLKDLAVDEIKIDRCFVSNIQHSAYNLRLLSNMMELADSCQIRVCCEGVEKAEELAVLEQLRPALYQGFLFAQPVPARDFLQGLSRWKNPEYPQLSASYPPLQTPAADGDDIFSHKSQIESQILAVTDDIISLCDVDTYEVYYLNRAGQRVFGHRDYRGRKCYKVIHGLDNPCPFCPNTNLRQDSFLVWENWNSYCNRHFLLRAKLLQVAGRRLRMEVSMDITKREYVSQQARERLEFSRKIVGYVQTLTTQTDYPKAINQLLSSVGDFYKAERAYLFEPNPQKKGYWDNTFEWCAPNVSAQLDNLQEVSPQEIQRWMDLFDQDESVFIYNMEPLKETSPLEWEALTKQGIQRLIAVPLRKDGQTVGFIGVDNPHYSIQDDSQVRVLASILVNEQRWEKR